MPVDSVAPSSHSETFERRVEARLLRLERGLRLWRRLALGLGLGLLAGLGWGAAGHVAELSADTVRAQRIELVNEQGDPVAVLASDLTGGQLRLYTHEGREHVRLITTGAGGELEMTSPSGVSLVSLNGGFLAGMLRVEAGMLRLGSKNLGSTTIMGRTIREGD
jgi:hypothetical protein